MAIIIHHSRLFANNNRVAYVVSKHTQLEYNLQSDMQLPQGKRFVMPLIGLTGCQQVEIRPGNRLRQGGMSIRL